MKQIRKEEFIGTIIDRGDGYFHWLQNVSGLSGPLSSMLAETVFVSVNGIDDVLVKKTKEEIRRKYAEDIAEKDELNDKETEALYKSICGDCCLFEVMVCLAYSLNEMFEDLDAYDGCAHFFGILLRNCGLDHYDEEDYDIHTDEVKANWEWHINLIIERTYNDDGTGGGLFPLEWVSDYNDDRKSYSDRRFISLWKQMNDWVDEHTNEDGEFVD